MSKAEQTVLLPSETDGWEVWKIQDGEATHERSLAGAVSRSDSQHGGCVAFSVCRVATLPIMVPSVDEELWRGAAQLELENSGLLVDVENYHGWDSVLVEEVGGQSFVSGVYLLEEELNAQNDLRNYSFDYSARFYRPAVDGDVIAIWRERHRWCLVFYRKHVAFLTEPLGEGLDDIGSVIRLSLTQLSMKGIDYSPAEVLCWSECDQQAALAEDLMAEGLVLTVQDRPHLPSHPAHPLADPLLYPPSPNF